MITAFINLKGGSTKSSSAVHLCRYLLSKGLTVALVDADSQATSSTWISNLEEDIPRPQIYRLTEPDPLLDRMSEIAESADHVVIDGAGGLAEVQRTILLLADRVLIPVQPSAPDISASHQAIKAVSRARQIRNGLPSAHTFLSRVVPKTLLLAEAREVLSAYQEVPLLQAEIPQRQVAADVMGQGATLFDLKTRPAKEVANFYRQLFEEVFNYGS